ncbi:hypothetical protein MHYP_G00117170 [Metynnis hypsauchen]
MLISTFLLHHQNVSQWDAAVNHLFSPSSRVEAVIAVKDVVSDASIDTAVKEVSSIVDPAGLNCIINNAGIQIDSDLNKVTKDTMMKTFESNMVAPLFVMKAFLLLLKTAAAASQGSGMGVHCSAVVNISSLLGSVQLNWGEGARFKTYAYRVSKVRTAAAVPPVRPQCWLH